jgi:hypothetical protein
MHTMVPDRGPHRDEPSRGRPAQPARSAPRAAAAQILALQRGAGNHAVSRMLAGPLLQRALNASRASGAWVITGRPPFSSATTSAMPVDTGDHRAHTTAWESIRGYVQNMLNSDGSNDHVYEVAVVHLLQPHAPMDGGYDTATAFAALKEIRRTGSDDAGPVREILAQLNGLLDNLDEGHGSTNSTIQGHYDPKVVSTGTGFDVRPGDAEGIMATAHLVKGLLLDETGQFILASTFRHGAIRGRIPVAQAEGTLLEMIVGNWYDLRKPRKRKATTATAIKAARKAPPKGRRRTKAAGKQARTAGAAPQGIVKPRSGRRATTASTDHVKTRR